MLEPMSTVEVVESCLEEVVVLLVAYTSNLMDAYLLLCCDYHQQAWHPALVGSLIYLM